MTSACADEQRIGTTRFTPIATRRALPSSKTAAANGPPVSRWKLVRASSITRRMRSSTEGNSRGAHEASSAAAQSGSARSKLEGLFITPPL